MKLVCDTAAHGLDRRRAMALLAAMGIGPEVLAQDAARTDPRSYRVLLENDRVRVMEYVSRPGIGICGEGIHSHPDHVGVALTPAKMRVVAEGGKAQVVEVPVGFVLWEEAGTHAVENVGGSGARFVMIELKGPGWAPSTG